MNKLEKLFNTSNIKEKTGSNLMKNLHNALLFLKENVNREDDKEYYDSLEYRLEYRIKQLIYIHFKTYTLDTLTFDIYLEESKKINNHYYSFKSILINLGEKVHNNENNVYSK